MSQMFQDRDGNQSSKRIIGTWVTAIGVAMLVTVAINSVIWPGDYKIALEASEVVFGGGMGLLGVSVLEYLGRRQGYSGYTNYSGTIPLK